MKTLSILTVLFFLLPITTLADCKNFPRKLETCEPFDCHFVHPESKEEMIKAVIPLDEETCMTSEQMPDNNLMKCRLNPELRLAVADYLKSSDGIALLSSEKNNKSVYRINRVEVSNPLQYAMETGACKVTMKGADSGMIPPAPAPPDQLPE